MKYGKTKILCPINGVNLNLNHIFLCHVYITVHLLSSHFFKHLSINMCRYRLRDRHQAMKFQLHAPVICANILHNIFWMWTASDPASVLVYRRCSSTMSFQASCSCCNGFCAQCWKALPVDHVRERESVGCQILVFTLPVCDSAQTGSQLDHGGQTDGGHTWQPKWSSETVHRWLGVSGSWPQLKEKKNKNQGERLKDRQSNKERKG